MPETSLISPAVVRLGGGLVLDKDTFSIPPGAALQLQNFEPDINGGYRRINGFEKYDTNQVGGSTGTILGVHIYRDQVIVAKDTAVYKGTGSGWTSIDTGRTSAGRFDFVNFNFNNTEKVIWCDGANNASVYDNSTVTDINASGAPADPQFVAVFKSHVFLQVCRRTHRKWCLRLRLMRRTFQRRMGQVRFVSKAPSKTKGLS